MNTAHGQTSILDTVTLVYTGCHHLHFSYIYSKPLDFILYQPAELVYIFQTTSGQDKYFAYSNSQGTLTLI